MEEHENEVRREWWATNIAKLKSKTFLGVVLFFCGVCICFAYLLAKSKQDNPRPDIYDYVPLHTVPFFVEQNFNFFKIKTLHLKKAFFN